MVNFPTRTQLWNGAVLNTIGYALWISVAENYYGAYWDGFNYVLDNGQGDNGVITFGEHFTVGVFFGHESFRNPFGSGHENPDYTYRAYFQGAPPEVIELAEAQTLRYRIEMLNGRAQPVITAVFWGKDDVLTSFEPWDSIWKHGGDILQLETMQNLDEAFDHIQDDYEYKPQQLDIIRAIYRNYLLPDPRFDSTALRPYFNKDGLALLENVGIQL